MFMNTQLYFVSIHIQKRGPMLRLSKLKQIERSKLIAVIIFASVRYSFAGSLFFIHQHLRVPLFHWQSCRGVAKCNLVPYRLLFAS